MDDRLTFKLELPEVRALPVVPRSHFSNSLEDVIYEPEPVTPIADEEGVPV